MNRHWKKQAFDKPSRHSVRLVSIVCMIKPVWPDIHVRTPNQVGGAAIGFPLPETHFSVTSKVHDYDLDRRGNRL